MQARWTAGLGLMVGGWLAAASAEDVQWRAAVAPPASAPAATSAVLAMPMQPYGQSAAVGARNADGIPVYVPGAVIPASYPTDAIASSPRAADPGSGILLVQGGDPPPPVAPGGSAIAPVSPGPIGMPPPPSFAPDSPAPGGGESLGFFQKCKEKLHFDCGNWDDNKRHCLQSDTCFEYFISPVSSPFLAVDPRALTEVRPIFMFQTIPASAPHVNGGNIEFLGAEASVAFTERLSLVMNELGAIWTNPHTVGALNDSSGLSELRIGPKYTFLRNEDTNTVAAFGLTFDIASGSPSIYQNTGAFSIAPYFAVAQKFGVTSYGFFDAMGTLGYNFSVNDHRSQFFYTNLHLDYDVAGLGKIYPLVELNLLQYTASGDGPTFAFEGGDLFNFGTQGIAGATDLTLALGARYKMTPWAQVGGAVEFPLVGSRDLNNFRLTLDFIIRY